MREIRIHARAGQGAITTATLLGNAYFLKGCRYGGVCDPGYRCERPRGI